MQRPTYIDDYKTSKAFNGADRLVFGTAGIGGVWGKVNQQDSIDALLYAFEQEITVLDTAASYADAQLFIGLALKQWKGERPFISTKIGRLRAEDAHTTYTDYSSEGLKRTLYENMETLGVDKIDLLFLHEPQLVPLDQIYQILETLQQFKADGLCDYLGVGGNPTLSFMPFVKKENFDVVSGFLHLNACNLTALDEQLPHFQKESIAYYAASPLHFGLLGDGFAQATQEPNEWITAADQATAIAVKTIAEKYDMPLSSLAQRYLFSIAEADRVVIGASTPQQIKATISDWRAGKLSENIFNEVTDKVIATRANL